MSIAEEKFPWESYTEWAGFIGVVIGLIVSFHLVPIAPTAEQIAGLATVGYLIVMIARKYGSGGKVVLKKSE